MRLKADQDRWILLRASDVDRIFDSENPDRERRIDRDKTYSSILLSSDLKYPDTPRLFVMDYLVREATARGISEERAEQGVYWILEEALDKLVHLSESYAVVTDGDAWKVVDLRKKWEKPICRGTKDSCEFIVQKLNSDIPSSEIIISCPSEETDKTELKKSV